MTDPVIVESTVGDRIAGGVPPDVSVLITAFNAAAYLQEAVDSVFAQVTGAKWELLIVDDGSTDETSAIAATLAERHAGRIQVLQHPGRVNRGISASRNLALAHAGAPIVALLDADDVWLPGHLGSQLPILSEHPEVAMTYAQAERWFDPTRPYEQNGGSAGGNFVPSLIPAGEVAGVLEPPTLLTWMLADESLVPCTCTVLIRTAVARRLGGFASEFRGVYDDQVFYAKLALTEKIFVSLDCVARYRQHPDSCCAKARAASIGEDSRAVFLAWLERYRSSISSP